MLVSYEYCENQGIIKWSKYGPGQELDSIRPTKGVFPVRESCLEFYLSLPAFL